MARTALTAFQNADAASREAQPLPASLQTFRSKGVPPTHENECLGAIDVSSLQPHEDEQC